MKKDLSKDIIEKIKIGKIKPKSKLFFIFINLSFWLFFSLSTIVGIIGFGVILGFIFTDDYLIYNKIGIFFLLKTYLPIFWLVFLVISVVISIIFFKKTINGYKYYIWQIILLNIFLTFIGGFVLFSSKLSNKIDYNLRNYFYSYNNIFVKDKESRMLELWQNENKGLLIGEIISILTKKGDNEKQLLLKDSNSKIWNIDYNKSEIKHNLLLENGVKIKIIGEKVSQYNFNAIQIRPYFGKNL